MEGSAAMPFIPPAAAVAHCIAEPPADLPRLPRREADSHKGSYGTVAVVGGSAGDLLDKEGGRLPAMIGAVTLAAVSAIRAGAGHVRVCTPQPVLHAAMSGVPSATGMGCPTDADGWYEPHAAAAFMDRVMARASVVAIGPGLGTSPGACSAALRAMQQDHLPLVMDADALNCLAKIPEFMRDFHAAAILTPHPGEFRTIVSALGLKGDLGMSSSRERAAEALAQRLGRVVVLKGHKTVVTDGQRMWVNSVDHPCMAAAGSGDVLTGLIAGLIAQYVGMAALYGGARKLPAEPGKPLDLFDAARVGVWAHGAAGVAWARWSGASAGMAPQEMTAFLPGVLERLRE